MYDKRLKIFIILSTLFLSLCIVRLVQMQLLPNSSIQDKIAEFKRQRGRSRLLKTVRGRILDRKGRILADDEPQFELHISYELISYLDDRLIKAKLLKAERRSEPEKALAEAAEQIQAGQRRLKEIIDKCVHFGHDRNRLEQKIKEKNDQVWNLRLFQAWRENCFKSELFQKHKDNLFAVKLSDFTADFESYFQDTDDRLLLVAKQNITEMHESLPLLELITNDDIFAAQVEFLNIEGVEIVPEAKRIYPYTTVAAQTIGWVSPAHKQDKQLFAEDRFSRYLAGELCGRRGVEYVCESILRGKRGEIFYDIDGNEIRTENELGRDVQLTIDIALQQKIEKFLYEYPHDPSCKPGMSAVVIDVSSADILALVSLPTFDLNRARYDYDRLITDGNEPMINRAIYKTYPPGSSVKPLILIAGLESANITPFESISCSAQKPPDGWPQCWINKQYPWLGHDDQFAADSGNIARNAIRGSCNIYFSRLADRIDSQVLQSWLFKFGYGRDILSPPAEVTDTNHSRNFLQASGSISSSIPRQNIKTFEQITPLTNSEKKFFGIGQGNLRSTPLQVTNAIAAIARAGLYKDPRLFIDKDPNNQPVSLGLKQQTLDTIFDGMHAVVNEVHGTAYKAFLNNNFAEQNVEVYGKTGSTEMPDNAWFAGFAKDNTGKAIALAVVVEGGQHGSSDAAPLAKQIIQFCIDSGYLGKTISAEQ
jgi:penicillin-binding protein 2